MNNDVYPMLEVNLDKMFHNISKVVELCKNNGIKVAGVIKGVNALEPIVNEFINAKIDMLASSRLEQLKTIKGKNDSIMTMLIRIPMLSEVSEMIKYSDISLNSERVLLDKIEEECTNQNRTHRVVLMADLGDLREGFFSEDELIETALYVENNLSHVHLEGIGVNLGCYGSIKPDTNNLGKLSDIAFKIENIIGRNLEIVSGGATSSLTLILDGKMPSKINHLRIGEAILLNRDLIDYWGYNMDFLYDDTMILKAEVVEVKDKPSYPIGEIFIDAFGNKPEYEDIGMRKRALLAVGKQDIGDFDKIIPLNNEIKLIGSSSDHLIADITEVNSDIKVGDIIEFKLCYQAMLYLTESPWVSKKYIRKSDI